MDNGRHPKVVRTWTVERIKPLPGPAEKHKPRPKRMGPPEHPKHGSQ